MASPQAAALLDTATGDRFTADARPATLARNAIELEVFTALEDAEVEWRAFQETADCTAFQSFDWLATWQHHIGSAAGVIPCVVAGRGADGKLLFILPLSVEPHGLSRRLTWLARDLCDYNGPLLAPHFEKLLDEARFAHLWRDIVDRLQRDPRLRFNVVQFDKMQAMVGGQPNPFMQLGVRPHANSAYTTRLSGDWEAFYAAKRSAETRGRERTKAKRLAKQGPVRFVSPTDAAALAETLETLMDQKSKAFDAMGVADIFARPGHRAFFHAVALQQPLVHVSRLDVGAQIAAANLGILFRGRYYHVLASYTDGELSRFSPGTAHLHEMLRYAIEHGCEVFDFTIGDERYKQEWSDNKITLFDHVGPATLSGWPMALWLRSIGSAKRFIKQGEARWKAAYRLRAALGPLLRHLRG